MMVFSNSKSKHKWRYTMEKKTSILAAITVFVAVVAMAWIAIEFTGSSLIAKDQMIDAQVTNEAGQDCDISKMGCLL